MLVSIGISTFTLWLAAKVVKANASWLNSLIISVGTMIISTVLGWILLRFGIVGGLITFVGAVAAGIILIYKLLDVSVGIAVGCWLLWVIFGLIVGGILSAIAAVVGLSFAINALTTMFA